jgi:hypothetical protein
MGIEADNELTGIERAHLANWLTEDSFPIVQKLMEDEIKKFNLNLINSRKDEDVIHNHKLAAAAAAFYQGLIKRINQEIFVYRNTPKKGDKPVDATESILNLDDIADAMANQPNLMEIE